ncbi:MAG: hypothetical protein L0Z50_40820 [Verrucomicrobiales bacterium]|nr:hypothetical protein [Verrucomicrobiales bacterium]
MVAKRKTKATAELAEGQLWRIRGGFVRIGHVGKSLVHYKMMNAPERRAVPVRISSIHEVRSFLEQNHAALVAADAAESPEKPTPAKTRR